MGRGGGRHSSWSYTTGLRTLGSAVPGTPSSSFTGSLAGLTVPQWRRGTRTAVGDLYLVEQADVLAGLLLHHQAHLLQLVHVKADQAWQILACNSSLGRLCLLLWAYRTPVYALLGTIWTRGTGLETGVQPAGGCEWGAAGNQSGQAVPQVGSSVFSDPKLMTPSTLQAGSQHLGDLTTA